MFTLQGIDAELEFQKAMEQKYVSHIGQLPEGSVFQRKEHGHVRSYLWLNGKEKYLGKKNQGIIAGVEQRKELERLLPAVTKNIRLLEDFRDGYTELQNLIPKNYTLPVLGRVPGRMDDLFAQTVEKWNKVKCGNPAYGPGKHTTSDGRRVRSRAELGYHEHMLLRGVFFKNEMPLQIRDAIWYPDFSILRLCDLRRIIWEHFGMMNIESYRQDAIYKLGVYASEGYYPMMNFIATYDFGDDKIDLAMIDHVFQMMRIID